MISFTVGAAVARADIPVLCADLADLLRGRPPGTVACDVAAVAAPDVVTVEALARLGLTARRHGWRLVVRDAGPALRRLLALLGLAEVLAEPGRQPEQREEPLGVQEVGDLGDPPG
ncbi:STAS domain-containing protein [Micromonospora sp. HK10]|uniref:STAS domain-containing protein n=1 Tax=Micromonospora sp. HK10 TaxID=1538294 RepID=UPI0006271C6D|nr:STAS domain-containing protein [Micromonospora sp. HK10]